MYCPNCGTPNADASKFCAKCGKAMPQSTPPAAPPQPNRSAASQTASVPAWRTVGIIALGGGGVSVVAFFLAWLTTPAFNLGGPSIAGQVTGWALFRIPIDFLTSLSNVRGGNLAGSVFGYLPGQIQLFVLAYFIDSLLLILTPVLGVIIAIRGWQIMQTTSTEAAAARQRSNRRLAIFGLIPPLGLLVLLLVLVAALSNPYGQRTDLVSVLRLFDIGYWVTLGALLFVIFAAPLAAPKQR
jgi:hypothetical protein